MKLQVDSDLSFHGFDTQVPILIQSQKKKTNAIKSMNKMNSINKMSKKNELKKMLRKGKADIIKNDFQKKLKRLIVPSQVPKKLLNFEMDPSNKWEVIKHKLEETPGLNISYSIAVAWALLNLFQTIAITFIASVMLAFIENKQNYLFVNLIYVSCFLHLIDVILNSTLQRVQNGRKLKNLKEIFSYYVANELKIDILYLISLILLPFRIHIAMDMCIQVVVFLKMFRSVNRVGLFQHIYIVIMSMEKYYQVAKVLLLNFAIAHIIAIMLILMSHLSEDNWLAKHGLQSTEWTQKYIWSYYWGVTIMLTVGFGDFAATNKSQALLLIFIQTFSCILLAYNINTVGVILNQIRIKQRQRKKRLTVFMRISDQQKISPSLSKEIASFIGQSFQIKDKFQYQEYQKVIDSLPPTVRSEFKMEVNKHIFSKIPFVNLLCKKSIMSLAQKIHIKIAHPEQIIYKKGQLVNLTILKKGKLALCCKVIKEKCSKNKLDGWVMQTLSSKGSEYSKLLSLSFLKNRVCNYDVKSLDYSVIYDMSMDQIIDSIRDRQFDYELLCQIRDKDEYYLDDNQIDTCEYCIDEKHNVFRCPKLHFVPLKKHVIFKGIKKQNQLNNCKEKRDKYHKRKKYQFKTLQGISIIQCQYQVFTEINYPDNVSVIKSSAKSMKNFIKSSCQKRFKQSLLSEGRPKDLTNGVNVQQEQETKAQRQESISSIDTDAHKGFWSLQCDKVQNFYHYFKHQNMESLNKNCLSIQKHKSVKLI